MNEIMERVAKAIFEAWAKVEAAESTWDDVCSRSALDGYPNAKKWRSMALAEALAAIEAMREPTASMIDAAKKAEYARYASPGESMITTNAQMIKLHHEAMIDEALR